MFKEMLTTFFLEFVEAFLPDVAAYLEPESIEFLDKEIITDVTAGKKHEVDLLVKARFRGRDTCFIIHVENQATPQADFPQRMFIYFARLLEKFNLPIYPVVIFSYDAPKRAEPNRFYVTFPGLSVVRFQYKVLQLNRMSWRKFITRPNPAAAALMTKMKIALKDRLRVTREIVRMLATLKLDPAKSQIIGGFMENYLKLTAEDMARYERRYRETLEAETEESKMEMWTSWGREGMQKGKAEIVLRQITKRFETVPPQVTENLDKMTSEQLNELAVDLLDFTSLADVEQWLSRHNAQ